MKVICSYDDFKIVLDNGKHFVMLPVELIKSVEITNQTEEELIDGCPCDYSGELDDMAYYCYWKEA